MTETTVQITSRKLLSMIACAPASMERLDVEREVRRMEGPAGTEDGWRIQERSDNPVTCASDPSRNHWLVTC